MLAARDGCAPADTAAAAGGHQDMCSWKAALPVLLLLLLAAILRRRLWKIKKLSAVLYHAQASIAPSAAVACNLIASVCAHSLLNWHGAWDQSADQGWMFTLGGGGGGPGGKAGTLGALCALCAGGGGTAFAP